ncbi:MAG: FHA domain-containing protein [Verrucomicrobiia bacterium]|jgi:pSer/pThr/pTyr-binding forkhead associated (FHA) protein
MAELLVISGKQSGLSVVIRNFPFVFGRSKEADLPAEEDGIFERHFQITHLPGDGYYIETFEPALISVNDVYVNKARLKNGDFIQAGNVKLRFWLAKVGQKNFRFYEILIWLWLVLLTFGQVLIIYILIRTTD